MTTHKSEHATSHDAERTLRSELEHSAHAEQQKPDPGRERVAEMGAAEGFTQGPEKMAKEAGGGSTMAGEATTTVKGVVSGAAEIGADVGNLAVRTVEGVLEATGEIGGNLANMAQVVLTGAIDAAGAIGTTAVRTVSGILVSVVEGTRDIVTAALPKTTSTSRPPHEAM